MRTENHFIFLPYVAFYSFYFKGETARANLEFVLTVDTQKIVSFLPLVAGCDVVSKKHSTLWSRRSAFKFKQIITTGVNFPDVEIRRLCNLRRSCSIFYSFSRTVQAAFKVQALHMMFKYEKLYNLFLQSVLLYLHFLSQHQMETCSSERKWEINYAVLLRVTNSLHQISANWKITTGVMLRCSSLFPLSFINKRILQLINPERLQKLLNLSISPLYLHRRFTVASHRFLQIF